MNITNSDVFILRVFENITEIVLHYRRHLKFCLKKEFHIGLPFTCSNDIVNEFARNPELISKLHTRGAQIGISLDGLTKRKLASLIANKSVNFINTKKIDIQSKEYVEEQKTRREMEELILNSSNLDQPSDVLD